METMNVKAVFASRFVRGLPVLLLLVLTQCVCSKNSVTDTAATEASKSASGGAKSGEAEKPVIAAGVALAAVLDLQDLDADERADLETVLKEQFDPCGGPMSFRESLAEKGTCDRAIKMGNFLVDLVAKGLSKKMMVLAYHRELKRVASKFSFTLTDTPFLGDAKSKNVIVEFTDFQCPYCQKVSQPLKALAKKYGAVLYIKHMPLDHHPASRDAAKASLAAHAQGKFWQVYDAFFANQAALSTESIPGLVEKAGVDMARFKKDISSDAWEKHLKRDEAEADLASADGTPTIYLNGYMVDMDELEAKLSVRD